VSLISPSFSAQDMRQTLGRLPRAFAKSGVIQKILIAAGTIEENVMRAIRQKLANMDALHGV
jgi:superfamily II DNA or RNA helicase